jgi:hypothetical protein
VLDRTRDRPTRRDALFDWALELGCLFFFLLGVLIFLLLCGLLVSLAADLGR